MNTLTDTTDATPHVFERYDTSGTVLDEGRYFRGMCSGGSEVMERVHRTAGAKGIDVSVNVMVKSRIEAITRQPRRD